VLTILPGAFVSACRGAKSNLIEDIHLSDAASKGNVPPLSGHILSCCGRKLDFPQRMKLYSNIEIVEGKEVFRTDHLKLIFEVDGWVTLQRLIIYILSRVRVVRDV
jgi:hypothetical protein